MSKQEPIKSEYQLLWEQLKALPAGKELVVDVHIRNRDTLIQALHRTKCADNVARKALGLPSFGKTTVRRYIREDQRDPNCKVGFILTFSLEQLV